MSSQPFRVEHDALGDVRLPADALYGAQTQRARENFPISGRQPYPAFVWSLATVKRAAAVVNSELGLLEPDMAAAIVRAADEVRLGTWRESFVVDPFQAGAGTSHNMNANEVLANRATVLLGGKLGEYRVHPNDHVNMAQSTNDTIPTAIRLGCLWRLDELLGAAGELAEALRDRAVAFDGVVKSGRTHLQDAVPIRLGQEFGGYARAVERDADRIRRAASGLQRLGIGGTAVGTGLNAHPAYAGRMVAELRRHTGFDLELADDLFESMQSMADLTDFSASMRTLAVTLTRIANDIRLLASGPRSGLDELRLPAVQPGSSIMPGKVNPVMAEMLNMAMYQVIGCDTTVALAAQAGQLELNVMMPVIAHNLFEMMHLAIGAIGAFTRRCIVGLEANVERAESWLQRNPVVATALNPLIGYAAAAALVKDALAHDAPILDVARQRAEAGQLRHKDEPGRLITPDEIKAVLGSLRWMTEGGLQR